MRTDSAANLHRALARPLGAAQNCLKLPFVRYAHRCTNDDCGHKEEFDLSIRSDPSVRQLCRQCGSITMERDFLANLQGQVLNSGAMGRDAKFPIVSDSLSEYAAGAKHDSEGRAIIESRRHAREVAKRNGYRWD